MPLILVLFLFSSRPLITDHIDLAPPIPSLHPLPTFSPDIEQTLTPTHHKLSPKKQWAVTPSEAKKGQMVSVGQWMVSPMVNPCVCFK